MQSKLERKETWSTIALFLIIVTVFSALFHYAIVKLYPSSIYIGGLMWCPALAAFLTLKIKGRKIDSLPWNWANWKYIRLSYFVPALYVFITYAAIWLLGFGGIATKETIVTWATEIGLMGIGTLNTTIALIIAVILVGTVSVVRAMATTLGEEIGWRGFFIFELRKVLSFTWVSLFSGIVWATWHWPLIVYYGNNIALELTTFYIFIISISFIMTYYTFKSKSVWPAVIFHAVGNVYVQKIFPKLTTEVKGSEYWLGEYGIMLAIVTFLFGIYYWRKALQEKL
tara:strand:+ start:565 stop:1416 length:852 start_codon:yes stop_codon:yes gene_type:complete